LIGLHYTACDCSSCSFTQGLGKLVSGQNTTQKWDPKHARRGQFALFDRLLLADRGILQQLGGTPKLRDWFLAHRLRRRNAAAY